MNTLSRRDFMKLVAASIPAVALSRRLAAETNPKRKPNIVFVFADQMRAQALGCMGDKQIITLNLDKLASEGLLVTNAISCQPVCSPYRAQLLTGRYGHTTGMIHNDIRLPPEESNIGDVLKGQGYTTGYIGKWHLSATRNDPVNKADRHGWDFWAVRNCSHEYFEIRYWLNDAKKPVAVHGWEPEVQTDLAIEYIRKNKEQPFCLFLSFGPPHNPYAAPEKYLKMYEGKEITPRPNVRGPIRPGSPEDKDMRAYYAMIASLDDCMGRISKALEEAGLSRDTILCFSSDHGDMLGSQGQSHKQRPWEESINIPFIIRYPDRIKAGQVRDMIVSSVDVMPTLLGMAGVAVPEKVQGMDLSSTIFGQSNRERDAAFLFITTFGEGPHHDWRGIRTKEWIYAYHAKGDWVMYNLKKDPYELKNLVNDPAFAEKKKELKDQLEAMRKNLGESLPLN